MISRLLVSTFFGLIAMFTVSAGGIFLFLMMGPSGAMELYLPIDSMLLIVTAAIAFVAGFAWMFRFRTASRSRQGR
jgi:hypothetical protein